MIKNLFHTGRLFLMNNLKKNLEPGIIFGCIQIGKKKKVSIIPKKHLVKNIGFVEYATHTKIKYKDWFNDLNTQEMKINNLDPETNKPNIKYDYG